MSTHVVFDESPIVLVTIDAVYFAADGLSIIDPTALLTDLGYHRLVQVQIRPGGVDGAPSGAVQDPSGSAVGARARPADTGAGGASGAIYARFADLEPIPDLLPGAAVFNSSTGPGRRVVHTHSPQLGGLDPTAAADRTRVLQQLANAYFNAAAAFIARSKELGSDGHVLNLVPISASIYAGRFRDPSLNHLHPGYTLVAVQIAVDELAARGVTVPNMAIYYHSPGVRTVAEAVAAQL